MFKLFFDALFLDNKEYKYECECDKSITIVSLKGNISKIRRKILICECQMKRMGLSIIEKESVYGKGVAMSQSACSELIDIMYSIEDKRSTIGILKYYVNRIEESGDVVMLENISRRVDDIVHRNNMVGYNQSNRLMKLFFGEKKTERQKLEINQQQQQINELLRTPLKRIRIKRNKRDYNVKLQKAKEYLQILRKQKKMLEINNNNKKRLKKSHTQQQQQGKVTEDENKFFVGLKELFDQNINKRIKKNIANQEDSISTSTSSSEEEEEEEIDDILKILDGVIKGTNGDDDDGDDDDTTTTESSSDDEPE